uniref:Uncharacterized protein n=1 Tax=Branchiostoma floridae TaxID=7739 RepID=C3ZYH6_BRAFL|eukprot:XP_002586387.1 hypothetical protein BRAFLDRAFT_108531 [Branchiostoma floridae]
MVMPADVFVRETMYDLIEPPWSDTESCGVNYHPKIPNDQESREFSLSALREKARFPGGSETRLCFITAQDTALNLLFICDFWGINRAEAHRTGTALLPSPRAAPHGVGTCVRAPCAAEKGNIIAELVRRPCQSAYEPLCRTAPGRRVGDSAMQVAVWDPSGAAACKSHHCRNYCTDQWITLNNMSVLWTCQIHGPHVTTCLCCGHVRSMDHTKQHVCCGHVRSMDPTKQHVCAVDMSDPWTTLNNMSVLWTCQIHGSH